MCALLALATGCVQRVMHVRSDPPGATVLLNDREIGRTPFDKEFLWYGNYDVVARADGYRTLTTNRELTAPWWQFVPFDLITDFLPLRDDEQIDLTLEPLGPANPADVLARAGDLRQRLESSGNTTNRRVLSVRPPSQPTTAATTRAATSTTTTPATTTGAP
jgi:hypothetical protein